MTFLSYIFKLVVQMARNKSPEFKSSQGMFYISWKGLIQIIHPQRVSINRTHVIFDTIYSIRPKLSLIVQILTLDE